MATKVNAKPALVATKDEFVCVDRKVWMAQESNRFLLGCL